jgi:glucokinase
MVYLGIDVGGHSIKAGIVTKDGDILDIEVMPTEAEKGRAAVIKNIEEIAKKLMEKHKDVQGIGIGIPGIVEPNGFVQNCPNIPFKNFNLGTVLRKKLKKKVVFGNDAKNFALAVHKFGAAKGYDNVLTLTLGTGVGSGLILNGKLFYNKGAPELGHTTIKYDSFEPKCCTNPGCLESLIGRKSFPNNNPLSIYRMATSHDHAAKALFSDYGRYLGIAISNFINIFNPEVIIIGGELSNAYPLFTGSMKKEIQSRALFHKTRIGINKLKYAGTIGAAILAFKK